MPEYIDTIGKSLIGIGVCDRCHMKKPIVDLVPDPNTPGLRVCPDGCADQYDPYRLPARPPDKFNMPFTRPDTPLDPAPAFNPAQDLEDSPPYP